MHILLNNGWRRLALPLICVMALAAPARAVTITATILHPVGVTDSFGLGASDASQVGYGLTEGLGRDNALLWAGTAASAVNLHPAGFVHSRALGATATSQVGWGAVPATLAHRALLWQGDAASVVNLHPAAQYSSEARGVSGLTQVGVAAATSSSQPHAVMWSGTAASMVDLNPVGFSSSRAYGADGASQAGSGSGTATGNRIHALLWNGTAASVVDLHPPQLGADFSEALAISGTSQVGYRTVTVSSLPRAVLWNGTAASAVDLHPATYIETTATGVAGNRQVGKGVTAIGEEHALLWTGSAASVVDLHSALAGLGPDFFQSYAYGVSDNGRIVGYARAPDPNLGRPRTYAVMWSVVPEPAGATLCALALATLVGFCRRRAVGV